MNGSKRPMWETNVPPRSPFISLNCSHNSIKKKKKKYNRNCLMLLNTSGGGRLCGYTTKDQCVVQFVQQQHFGY